MECVLFVHLMNEWIKKRESFCRRSEVKVVALRHWGTHVCVSPGRGMTRGRKKKWDRPLEQLLPRACPMFLTHTHTQVECLDSPTPVVLTELHFCSSVLYLNSAAFTANLRSLKQADHHCYSGRTPTSLREKCTESFSTEIRAECSTCTPPCAKTWTLFTSASNSDQTHSHRHCCSLKSPQGARLKYAFSGTSATAHTYHQMSSSTLLPVFHQIPQSSLTLAFLASPPCLWFSPRLWSAPQGSDGQMRSLVLLTHTHPRPHTHMRAHTHFWPHFSKESSSAEPMKRQQLYSTDSL